MQNQRSRAGFTLAELLIVVAIIAILAAIAFPSFAHAKKSAQLAVDDTNIRIGLSAYHMAQMTDGVALEGSDELTFADQITSPCYVASDGTMTQTITKAYVLQEGQDECPISASFDHVKGNVIALTYNESDGWLLQSLTPGSP